MPRFPSFIMHVYKGVVGVSFLLAVFCQGIVLQLQGVKFQQVRRLLPSITCHCMQGRVFTLPIIVLKLHSNVNINPVCLRYLARHHTTDMVLLELCSTIHSK